MRMRQLFPKYNVQVQNQADSVLDIYVDGVVVDAEEKNMREYYLGDRDTSVSYVSFRDAVLNFAPKVLNVYVNSPGGDVSTAMAIHDFLRDQEGRGIRVNRIGRGRIASAGTYILMGNNSEMSENSLMMIHNISMIAFGNIDEIEAQAKAGRKFNNLIRDFYVNHTNKEPEQISKWMNSETWFTAEEAKQYGFIKNTSGKVKFSNTIKPEHWQFSNRAILNSYNADVADEKSESVLQMIKNEFSFIKQELMGAFTDRFKKDTLTNAAKTNTLPANATMQDALIFLGGELDKRLENLGTLLDEQVNQNGTEIRQGFENDLVEQKKANDELKNEIATLKGLIANFQKTADNLTNEATVKRGGETKPKNTETKTFVGKFKSH